MAKKINVTELKTGDNFITFFLIRKAEGKNAGNGSRYLDLVLGDASGEISAKLWDCKPEDEEKYRSSMLVKVKGSVGEWQGKKQVKIDKIRLVNEKDELEIAEFVPAAPYSPQEMVAELRVYLEKINNKKLKQMIELILAEAGNKLLTHPAAVSNHHAVRSGLLYHTLTMLKAGEKLSEVYTFLDTDLLYAGIVLHDMAKLEEIEANEIGLAVDYSLEGHLLGHIVQGIKKIDRAARSVGLEEELSLLLQHMILAHHYEPEFGSPKKPMLPEAEVLHYLDILDARMYDMQKVMSELPEGGLSEKIWVLNNRKIYKPRKDFEI